MSTDLLPQIEASLGLTLSRTALGIGKKYTGKVRDVYEGAEHLVLVTSDRQSAFDRLLASVPFKGQVLNMTSGWWFSRTEHIIPNHVVATPHPNVTIARKCTPFRIEFVVRAYLTGSTSTSIWMHYKEGTRLYCGHKLPDGMRKNQALPEVLVTPTTKEEVHDRPISAAEIVAEGWMEAADWEYTASKALELFKFGQAEAASRGLILVDTKYEFGKDAAGVIRLIDEVHTPDSSRYWLADSYAARLAEGKEPDNIDKEFLRIWFRDHCDPYNDLHLPPAPPALVAELSRRYIYLYERITGQAFTLPTAGGSPSAPTPAAITAALAQFFTPAARRVVVMYDRESGGETAQALLKALSAATRGKTAAATAGAPERTAVALEHYAVDVAAAPLPLLELCKSITAEPFSTVFVVVAKGRVDDLSRLLTVQTRLPAVLLLPELAGAGAPGAEALASLHAAAAAGVLVGTDVDGTARAVARLLSL